MQDTPLQRQLSRFLWHHERNKASMHTTGGNGELFCSMHASSSDDRDMKDLHTRNVKSMLRLKPMHAITNQKAKLTY